MVGLTLLVPTKTKAAQAAAAIIIHFGITFFFFAGSEQMHTIVRRWGFFVTRFYTVWPVCCNDWLKEHLGNNLGVYTDQQWKPSGVHTPVYQCFSVRDIPMGSAKRWETICGDPRRKRAREQGFRRVEEKKKRKPCACLVGGWAIWPTWAMLFCWPNAMGAPRGVALTTCWRWWCGRNPFIGLI